MEFLEKAGFVLRVLGIDDAMTASGKESVYLNPRKVLRKKSPRAEGVEVMQRSVWVLRLTIQKNRLPCLLVHGDSKNPHDEIVLLCHPWVSQAIRNS